MAIVTYYRMSILAFHRMTIANMNGMLLAAFLLLLRLPRPAPPHVEDSPGEEELLKEDSHHRVAWSRLSWWWSQPWVPLRTSTAYNIL